MSLAAPGGVPLKAEDADNYEEIEKQFAVRGASDCAHAWDDTGHKTD
jgi:hypothetical protein